jgi:Uma2 family endonuclease
VIGGAAFSSWSTVFSWRRSWVIGSEYFAAGCRLVWLVDPRTRTVAVYTSVAKPIVITEKQTLSGGDVLPGFRLPLRKLFGLRA